MGKDHIIGRIDRLMVAKDTMVGTMAGTSTALDKQQRLLDGMLPYLEGFEIRMRTLEGLARVPAGVPSPRPYFPRDHAPEALLRRTQTVRTIMEEVRPMDCRTESNPYGQLQVDFRVPPFIPEFSANMMFGEKTTGKGSGIVNWKQSTQDDTVEMDIGSPSAARTFDARAPYERRVAEMDSQVCGGSIGESCIQDRGRAYGPWSVRAWREAESGPRKDMEIRGVYSHSPGNWSGGSILLQGAIASDVGDTVHMENLQGVKISHYDANPANLDDFILDWQEFAEEGVGEMWFGSDVRDKWACRTFAQRLAPELGADLRDAIRE